MLAHIGGVPVEESLLYLAPVILLVGWMYFAGWRERRRPGQTQDEEERPSAAVVERGGEAATPVQEASTDAAGR